MRTATGAATQEALTMLFAAFFDNDPLRIEAALRQLEFLETITGLAREWHAEELGATPAEVLIEMAVHNELLLASRPSLELELERASIGEGPGALAMADGR